jgi:hypothetical protein
MPGGDRTGPWGAGPMTGRAAGYCAGYSVPGYTNPVFGRGFGAGWGGGWGRGWGYRNRFYATGLPGWYRAGYAPAWGAPYAPPMSREQEAEALEQEVRWAREQLGGLEKRLSELRGGQEGEEQGGQRMP